MTSQELKEKLSVEDVIKYVTEFLGSDEPEFDPNDNPIFQTVCHNPAHHGKHKLFYYVESKQFHCYTECAENFDIFGLTCRAKGYDPVMEFRKAFNDVLNFFHLGGIQFGFGNDKKEELSDGWNILQKFKDFNAPRKELQPLPKVQENILEYFGFSIYLFHSIFFHLYRISDIKFSYFQLLISLYFLCFSVALKKITGGTFTKMFK